MINVWRKHWRMLIPVTRIAPWRRIFMSAAVIAIIILAALVAYNLMRPHEEEGVRKQALTPDQDPGRSDVADQNHRVPADNGRVRIEEIWDESLADLFPPDVDPKAYLALDWPEVMTRIRKQIEMISDESLPESMDNLYQVNTFTWPGWGREGLRHVLGGKLLPLPPALGESDLHSILSNRRFARILQELSQMPKQGAADLVSDSLERSLATYRSLLADYIEVFEPRFRADSIHADSSGGITGPVWICETVDETEPVLLGTRYNVLALVWLAGSLGLTECHEEIKEIARQETVQRDRLYGDDHLHQFYRSEVLEKLSLYNRQILAFGLVGTSARAADLQQSLAQENVARIRLETSRFDALLTPYDLPVRSGYAEPDMSQGIVAIECYAAISDSTFDKLLSSCAGQDD